MNDQLLKIIARLESQGLLADSPDNVDALMGGLPLLAFWHGQVRWTATAEIMNEEPPEWWEPSLHLQRFAGNMYGDHWCFQPTEAYPTAVTHVAHDLDEATCFAPSFELFLFRATLNALTFCSEHTWRDWSRDEVAKIMSGGVDVVSTLVSAKLALHLKNVMSRGAQFAKESQRKYGYYSWLTQEEADGIVASAAEWTDLDKTFNYSIPLY